MGKLYLAVSLIKSVMNFLGQPEGIQQSILAGGSLTGYYRAHLGTGSSGYQTGFSDKLTELIDLVIGNSGNLHRQTRGIRYRTISVFLRRLCDHSLLLGRNLSVYRDNTGRKIVCSLVA